MRRFNPVQQMIRGQHPFPSAGATGVLRLADLPQAKSSVADSLLEFLLSAGEADGHWVITSQADGDFHYELTAEGARFLRDAGDG